MKQITSTIILIALVKLSFCQIQIGLGTTPMHFPIPFYNGCYSMSQTIYLKSDINQSGVINSISYYAINRSYADDVRIYMAETGKSEFSSENDWAAFSSFKLVYEGKFPEIAFPGWSNVELQNKFVFSNTKNLIVLYYKYLPGQSNTNESSPFWSSSQNRASISLPYINYYSKPDPLNPPPGLVYNNIPTTKLGISNFLDNDLAVNKVEISNPYALAGEIVTISVTIQNIGKNAKSNVPVIFKMNGKDLQSTNVNLSPLEEKVITFNWTVTEGNHVFEAKTNILDDNNLNNSKTLNFVSYRNVFPNNSSVAGRLTLANSPYQINGLVTVPQGRTLTIDPGVVLRFKTGTDYTISSSTDTINIGALFIEGNLIANGTTEQRINFTRQGGEGNWGCIAFPINSSGSSSFKFCNVEYANQFKSFEGNNFDGAISIWTGIHDISYCRITDNLASGIRAVNLAYLLIKNSVIARNNFNGIENQTLNSKITNNTIVGNKLCGILAGVNTNSIISNCIFWNNLKSIYSEGYLANAPTLTYCLFQEDLMPGNFKGNNEGCIFKIDPKLEADYSIPLNSPCINAGRSDTTGLNVGLVDYLGNSRVIGSRIDIGATEGQDLDHIMLTSPIGGEAWASGSASIIKWRGNANNVKLEYSADRGSSWNTIITSTPNDGIYQWQIPPIESQHCLVKISDVSKSGVYDISDAPFTIFKSIIPDNTLVTGRLIAANSPYKINGLIIVPHGDSLIIDPGVELQFKTGDDFSFGNDNSINVGGLFVKGKLIAEGISKQRITFTREGNSGNWGCIAFHSASNSSLLKYCNIEYANQIQSLNSSNYDGAITVGVNGFTISHCRVSDNLNHGIYSGYASTAISNCIIARNSKFGVYQYGTNCMLISNTIINNKSEGVSAYNSSVIKNCIFWGNNKSFSETYNINDAPTVTYSLIQEKLMPAIVKSNNEGCIFNINPQIESNYGLLASSPLINKGSPGISDTDGGVTDFFGKTRIFDGTIDIGASEFQSTKRIKLISPNGNEKLISGNNCNIQWSGNISKIKLEYSPDSCKTWIIIADNLSNTGQKNWLIPLETGFKVILRISDSTEPTIHDTSDSIFTISKNDAESHLISYWNFDNYSFNDLTANNNHGIRNGDAFFGNGLKDKTLLLKSERWGDYLVAKNQISVSSELSISMWFKTASMQALFCLQPTGENFTNSILYIGSDGNLYLGFYNLKNRYTIKSTLPINNNQWHFAIVTFKPNNMSLYIDGTKVASLDTLLSTNGFMGICQIGYGETAQWPMHFNDFGSIEGEMDEVKLYDIALTETQVQKMGVLICPKVNFSMIPHDASNSPDSVLVVNKSSKSISISSITSSNGNYNVLFTQPVECPSNSSKYIQAVISNTAGSDSTLLRMKYRIDSKDDFDSGYAYFTRFKEDGSEKALYAKQAVDHYDSCFMANPNSSATFNNLGVLYRLAENQERAFQVLSYALKVAQDNKTGYTGIKMNIGVVQSDRKNSQNAKQYYEGSFSDISSNAANSTIAPQIYFNQAWEHFVNDSLSLARMEAWATINHLKSNNYLIAKAYALLGVIEATDKDTIKAIDYSLIAYRKDLNGPIGNLAKENLKLLKFTIPDPIFKNEYITICNGQNYQGWIITGEYKRTLAAINKADSIVTTFLTVNPVYNITEQISICKGDNYNNWTSSGTYKRTLQAKTGCDSIVTTNLAIYPVFQPAIINVGDTLKSVEAYQNYKWFDDKGVIPNAIASKYIINKSGKYHLVITDNNGCTQTSGVLSLIPTNLKTTESLGFNYSIIPNPNNGQFRFRIDSAPKDDFTLKLINSVGQLIESRLISNSTVNHFEEFEVTHLSKGIYLLVISSDWVNATEKIIVQ